MGKKKDPLGYWLKTQREARRKGRLPPDRMAKLNQIPGWTPADKGAQWDEQYGKVLTFFRQHGRAPARRRKHPQERSLGQWLMGQRSLCQKGKLSLDQSKRLEQIPASPWAGKGPQPSLGNTDWWSKTCDKIGSFLQKHDKMPTTTSKNLDEAKLGTLAARLRRDYKAGDLSVERIHDLNQMSKWSWSWSLHDDKWNEKLKGFRAFIEKHCIMPSPKSSNRLEKTLGKWSSDIATENCLLPGWNL